MGGADKQWKARGARWVIAATLCLLWTHAAQAEPLRLGDDESYETAPAMRVFPAEPDATLADFDALRDESYFANAPADPSRHLREDGDVWVLFDVTRTQSSPERDWVIWTHGAAQWLDARVAVEGESPEVYRNGFFVSPEHRPLQALGYAFPLRLEPGQRAEVVMRGYLPPRDDHRITVATASHFRLINLLSFLLVFGVMGAALALGSYNAVMFVVVRESTYGYYALYALSSVFLWGTTHSVFTLFTGDGHGALTLNGLAVLMTAFAALRFTHDFLDLRETAPRLHVAFQVLSVLFLVLTVALFVLPQPQFKLLAAAAGIPTMAVVVFTPIYALARGYRRARFMVIGWAPLMVFPLLLGLRALGLIEGSWVSAELMLAVHGFEILTMALAVGDRWRELEQARAKAQSDALEQLELRLAQSEELARARIAGQQAQLEAEYEKMRASLDALTGLRNRRAFDSEFPRMSQKWIEGAAADTLLCVIDVDGLKRVNDERGHAEGDRLLTEFGKHLSTSLRGADQLYRLGGDEFAVLAHAPSDGAVRAIEARIREAIAALEQEFPGAGASLGSARLSETDGDLEEAYALADGRMYEEKRAHHESAPRE